VGVDYEEATFALIPFGNVLPNEVFEHLGLACTCRAANVKMRRAHLRRHYERSAVGVGDTELYLVSGRAAHGTLLPAGS